MIGSRFAKLYKTGVVFAAMIFAAQAFAAPVCTKGKHSVRIACLSRELGLEIERSEALGRQVEELRRQVEELRRIKADLSVLSDYVKRSELPPPGPQPQPIPSEYVTEGELADALKLYAKSEDVSETYVDHKEFETAVKDFVTNLGLGQILSGYLLKNAEVRLQHAVAGTCLYRHDGVPPGGALKTPVLITCTNNGHEYWRIVQQ